MYSALFFFFFSKQLETSLFVIILKDPQFYRASHIILDYLHL